ncbi:hypothetical protein LOTGIDRAFT_175921 [Lottia gigantea]|uniref:Uncharacterized protein n=1 Tax=Lottia gigantea TaxID=225164 RepID=V3ZUM9_LOTGI|nr:hypothetical protein LOTGIDRAFT_175921 [Lottia gigantea]ESO88067.1 hypothetical protein LOTGIDRAFT_175921 [Lottia gigantea]
MARTKNTRRLHQPHPGTTRLPRAQFVPFAPLAPDLRDPTARVPTRPTIPGARRRIISPTPLPSLTPPPRPISPLPPTPPRLLSTLAPDLRPESPPMPTSPEPQPRRSLKKTRQTKQFPTKQTKKTKKDRQTADPLTRGRKSKQMKEMVDFIKRLKRLNPEMVYTELVRNVGTARIGLLQWFKLAANHLLKGNIQQLHAQHTKWVARNKDVLKQLT